MRNQLETWEGEFGVAYTDRNIVDPAARIEAFRTMVGGLDITRLLEVGCNRGHNLVALHTVLGDDPDVVGIEPNIYAREIARRTGHPVLRGDACDLLFRSGAFDLVMTVGVLIHIPLEDLTGVMKEIVRVSSRYILCVEYFAEEETEIEYRGNRQLLWKRDFLKHYQQVMSGLRVERSGYWTKEHGFDRANWWLLGKPSAT